MATLHAEIHALREQLAAYFPDVAGDAPPASEPPPSLAANSSTAVHSGYDNGYNGTTRARHAGPDERRALHLETSVWPAFHALARASTAASRPGGGENDSDSNDDDDDDDNGDAVALFERTIDQFRLRTATAHSQALGQWRRAWNDVRRQTAGGDGGNSVVPSFRVRYLGPPANKVDAGSPPPASVIRLPPLPAPLPPCLQCVLAGVCCSLTTTPHAQAFVNDRAGARGAASSSSWPAAYARLVREVDADCGDDWAAFTTTLPRRRQQLEQRLLRQAVVRGATDSPFLPPPPPQCARCLRTGERGCLQQSRDLTMTTTTPARETAWFASSGPPPLSLLRHHGRPLLDQIRFGPSLGEEEEEEEDKGYSSGGRYVRRRHQLAAPLRLEAIFCRDPAALTAAEVAARAQRLLAQIADKPHRFGRHAGSHRLDTTQRSSSPPPASASRPDRDAGHSALRFLRDPPIATQTASRAGPVADRTPAVRPATAREVARLLPRRSPLNVYGARGVATVAAVRAAAAASADLHGNGGRGDSVPVVPPALPAWSCHARLTGAEAEAGTGTGTGTKPPPQWQEHFLDVGEERAFRRLQREAEGRPKNRGRPVLPPPSSLPTAIPASHTRPGAPVPDNDNTARTERLSRLAAALADRLRAGRPPAWTAADGGSPPSPEPLPLPPPATPEQARFWAAQQGVSLKQLACRRRPRP